MELFDLIIICFIARHGLEPNEWLFIGRGILSMHTAFLMRVCVCTSEKKHRERLNDFRPEYILCLPGADMISC